MFFGRTIGIGRLVADHAHSGHTTLVAADGFVFVNPALTKPRHARTFAVAVSPKHLLQRGPRKSRESSGARWETNSTDARNAPASLQAFQFVSCISLRTRGVNRGRW